MTRVAAHETRTRSEISKNGHFAQYSLYGIEGSVSFALFWQKARNGIDFLITFVNFMLKRGAKKPASPAPRPALQRGGMIPRANVEFLNPGMAISCDLRAKFTLRTTKICVHAAWLEGRINATVIYS